MTWEVNKNPMKIAGALTIQGSENNLVNQT